MLQQINNEREDKEDKEERERRKKEREILEKGKRGLDPLQWLIYYLLGNVFTIPIVILFFPKFVKKYLMFSGFFLLFLIILDIDTLFYIFILIFAIIQLLLNLPFVLFNLF